MSTLDFSARSSPQALPLRQVTAAGSTLPWVGGDTAPTLRFGPFCLQPTQRILLRGDDRVPLGGRALDILSVLIERAGEVVGKRDLLSQVWPDVVVEESNLRVHLAALRKALGEGQDGARYITCVPGRGYCFVAPVKRSVAEQVPESPNLSGVAQQPLPPRLRRMVGRDQVVAEICELLRSTKFVSVVAAGGMGKTTVAIAVAHALAPEFEHGCYFVDLATIGDGALVASAVASSLGCLRLSDDPVNELLSVVSGRRLLLVLDNCEHVIESVASVSEQLRRTAPHVHLLTTSREALRAEGENVHLLSPLEAPQDDQDLAAPAALMWPAVQLFMERATASGHRTEFDDSDARTVAQICRRLDGIPVAIELAAARVGAYGIRGTAQLLDNRFRLLWHGRRSALPRHQTLQAMLDWSYNLLGDYERQVLRRLSIFVGAFTVREATAVASESPADDAKVVEAMDSLVEKSLLLTSSAGLSTVYRLLDITRAYASVKLIASGEQDVVAKRHAQSFAAVLGGGETCGTGSGALDLVAMPSGPGGVLAELDTAGARQAA